MSSLETKSIKQKIINNTVQPLYIGGTQSDNSDPDILITDNGISLITNTSIANLNVTGSANFSVPITATKFNNNSFVENYSITSQSPTAATRTYITGSNINFIANSLAVGTRFFWVFDVTKTAAGIAESTIDIAVGTTGTISDSAILSFIKPAGTAVIDNGLFRIDALVRSIGASTVIVGHMQMTHNLSATGLATIPCVDVTNVSSSFDSRTATKVGLCITTGAADAYTIQMVYAQAWDI